MESASAAVNAGNLRQNRVPSMRIVKLLANNDLRDTSRTLLLTSESCVRKQGAPAMKLWEKVIRVTQEMPHVRLSAQNNPSLRQ